MPHLGLSATFPFCGITFKIGSSMNLLDFKQTTSYFTKKRPIVFLLFLFSIVCLIVSVQSGSVFIHSFLSAYVPDISWFWCYLVSISIDCILFYLCAQLFSDLFCGLEGQNRYLDFPTSLLFCCFLGLSLFMSVKGADVRKSHHATELASDNTTSNAIGKMVASLDTSKVVVKKGIERNERKALEAKAKQAKENTAKQKLLLSALELHKSQQVEAKKEFSDLLDFSKSIVVIFQLLLIVCCASSEYMKSKKESNSKIPKALLKVNESTVKATKSGNSESNSKKESKSKSIGFGNSEGHIWNSKIAYKKANGELKYYKSSELSSMITDARKRGKEKQAKKFESLKQQLKEALA